MPGSSSRGVFLNYRREDAGAYARLRDFQLSDRFPSAAVFMDLDRLWPRWRANRSARDVLEAASASFAPPTPLASRRGMCYFRLADVAGLISLFLFQIWLMQNESYQALWLSISTGQLGGVR